MTKKILSSLNYVLFGLCTVLFLLAFVFTSMRPSEITAPEVHLRKSVLPKTAFELSSQAYAAIGEPFLVLQFAPATLQLPDLRTLLTYHGTNGRPDATMDRTILHFGMTNNKGYGSVPQGERLYLLYDKKQTPPRYVFSPNNAETSLWIEPTVKEKEAIVSVGVKNEKGEIIHEPEAHAQFALAEKELLRVNNMANWEIGKWRVDGTLLARQRARWFGFDRFLEKHGGEEFLTYVGKQRIDFGEGEDTFSCYVQEGDSLVWVDNRWKEVTLGEKSRGLPLLHVKKVDERIINMDLWDSEGKNKIALNLLKSTEPWTSQNLQKTFKFVGARTRTQCVFEIDNERMLLQPHDWLVFTEEGWKKLETSEEVDDYVNRKLKGMLFVFDGFAKKDDKQMLVGTLFNSTRTDMQTIELTVQQGNVTNPTEAAEATAKVEQSKSKEPSFATSSFPAVLYGQDSED